MSTNIRPRLTPRISKRRAGRNSGDIDCILPEIRYRNLFEQSLLSLQILSPDGRTVQVNRAFTNLWGLTEKQLKAADYNILEDEQLIASGAMPYIRAGFRGHATVLPPLLYDPEKHPNLKSGRKRWVSSLIYPIKDEKGKILELVMIHQDITDRKITEEALEQYVGERTRELSTLLKISGDMASTLELEPLLQLILDELKLVVSYEAATIGTIEGNEIVTIATRRPDREAELAAMHLRYPIDPGNAMMEIIFSRTPVIIHDVRDDSPISRSFRRISGNYPSQVFNFARSWLGVPLEIKGRLIGVLSLIHSQPDFYNQHHAGLAAAFANHASLAIENARLYERAQEAAALEERQRLARELHDSVSQALFGISVGTNSLKILLERDPKRIPQTLEYVSSLAQAGMAEMRALLFELRPESLQNEGLVAALTKQAAAVKARHGIEVLTEFCSEPEVPLKIKEALYRIGQESMNNTIKHANAQQIKLNLNLLDGHLNLVVLDDGVGFDTGGSFPGHLGLHSMEERAAKIGGRLEITSRPGSGTCIQVRVPVLSHQ